MRILNVKTEAVTTGVLDKGVQIRPDHVEVTYADHNGTPHTIFYHKEGPFKSPEEAVQAHLNHELHTDSEAHDAPDTPHPLAGPVLI